MQPLRKVGCPCTRAWPPPPQRPPPGRAFSSRGGCDQSFRCSIILPGQRPCQGHGTLPPCLSDGDREPSALWETLAGYPAFLTPGSRKKPDPVALKSISVGNRGRSTDPAARWSGPHSHGVTDHADSTNVESILCQWRGVTRSIQFTVRKDALQVGRGHSKYLESHQYLLSTCWILLQSLVHETRRCTVYPIST